MNQAQLDSTTQKSLEDALINSTVVTPKAFSSVATAYSPTGEPRKIENDKFGDKIESNSVSSVQVEIDNNRNSPKSMRLQTISIRRDHITRMEEQIEKLVASYNVANNVEQEKFDVSVSGLRAQVSTLLAQVEAINSQIAGEEQRHSTKKNEVRQKFESSMEDLRILLDAEKASLAVLENKTITPSPFAEAAIAQPNLPDSVRRTPIRTSTDIT